MYILYIRRHLDDFFFVKESGERREGESPAITKYL